MRVSIVVGGRWHAFDLARELHQRGALHRLVTTYPKFKAAQWGVPKEKIVSLPLSLLIEKAAYRVGTQSLVMRSQFFRYNLFAQMASKYLEGSTVIHGWSSFSEPSLLWAKQHNIPFLLERSSSHIVVQGELLREEFKQLGLNWVETHPKVVAQELQEYDLADHIAVPSLFVKQSFSEQGFAPERLVHNPFGTNITSFTPGDKQDSVFRVIYAGALSIRKGIHHLVQAFLTANIPNSELLLVGSPTTETPHLLKGSDERVKMIGRVAQACLATYYRNSSIFVMASIEEGLACVQAQALACGLPLICTTNTGGEDLLKMSNAAAIDLGEGVLEYPAGYVVPVRTPGAIATLLQQLAAQPSLLKQKREAALQLRSENLNWKEYANRAILAYGELSARVTDSL